MGRGQELLDAAREGDRRTVEKILGNYSKRSGPFTSLRRGAGPNVQDDSGYTPLHHACLNGRAEIVRLLLQVDASPCIVDKKGATPLHLAAFRGDGDVVRMLLAHEHPRVNIDQLTSDHETALLIAAHFGYLHVVAQLIRHGADVSIKNKHDDSALDLAAQYGRLATVLHLLEVRPQLVEQYKYPMSRGRVFPNTPLHRASKNGRRDVVKALIDAGMDPNLKTKHGTPLHEAARFGKASVVRILLKKGADLNVQDAEGKNVYDLMAEYPPEATSKVMKVIREYHATDNGTVSTEYDRGYNDSDEELPPFPVQDSPTGTLTTTATEKNTNPNQSYLSSSVTKYYPQSFVKKLASRCLGLKAKFNSAPNISNTSVAEIDVKSKLSDSKSNTSTLLIGNSKFFKMLSKKEESGDIVCNDEFDTISLDRLGTLNRDNVVNRSNRSCPGFKTSLPNITENNELSESEDSVPETIPKRETKNETADKSVLEAINYDTNFNIFEPRKKQSEDAKSIMSNISLVNECYESYECKSSVENISSVPKPPPRTTIVVGCNSNDNNNIYENVAMEVKTIPKPAARTHIPKKPIDETPKNLYENISLPHERKIPEPSKRTTVPEKPTFVAQNTSPLSSRSSTLSSDSMDDETHLEDILLSTKSKSFCRKSSNCASTNRREACRSQSNASDSSNFTEASALENVDCSDDIADKSIYLSMTGTLPNKKTEQVAKKKVLFRHKTFTNIEADRNSTKVKDLPQWNNSFLKETLAHYHIRGTGHCIYNAPTVQEFIYIFNRDTLYSDVPPFTKVPNLKRDSYFETAICFCKQRPPKFHNSAEDLLDKIIQDEESKVTIDVEALQNKCEMSSSSFQCYCDSGSCTLHSVRRKSPLDLVVKFSAIKRSISTPDITLDKSPISTAQKYVLPKNKSVPNNLEEPYAVVSVEDIIARKSQKTIDDPPSPIYTPMSHPSTLSSAQSAGLYSVKDIADVISLNDSSTSTATDSSRASVQKSCSSECSDHWSLQSCNSNVTIKSDASFKTCLEESDSSDDGTLHSDAESSDAETIKSDVSTGKRPWVHSDSFRFGGDANSRPGFGTIVEEKRSESLSSSGICVEGSESSSGCDDDGGIPRADAGVSLGCASLERGVVSGRVRSGSRRRWDEAEGTSEGDALSVSSAASSCAPLHLHHHAYSKVSGTKHYLKHGRSVDQYVDGKLSYSEYEENHNPRLAPVPNPRPSLKQRPQPVAITAMYENVVIKEQNPRRKLRRNNFVSNEGDQKMGDRVRKYSNQERSSLESLLDDQSMNSPSDCERYYEGPRVVVPSSPTHYKQPPTPDHPPPSARQAENCIHERIRPLSQLIMEVVEEIRIRKKSQGDIKHS